MSRENLEKWAADWANNDDIPDHAMSLFLDAAEALQKTSNPAAKSESLADYSVSYGNKSALESVAESYLTKYRRIYND